MLQVSDQISIPKHELHFSFSKSPGPGGQNVNKLNTKATLRWRIQDSAAIDEGMKQRFLSKFSTRVNQAGEVVIVSHEERSQTGNQEACLSRLRALLLQVLKPPKKRHATKPSKGSKRRRLESKRRISEKKQFRSQRGTGD